MQESTGNKRFQIDGKGNFIVEGNANSPVTINVNTGEVLEYIKHLKELQEIAHPSTIHIIVLASINSFVQKLNEDEDQPDLAPLLPQHGESALDWKPFGTDRTIGEMMVKFKEETGYKINVHFLHELALTQEEVMQLEEGNGRKIIFVVDPLALKNTNNALFSDVIRLTINIGGGIIPMNSDLDRELKDYLTSIYEEKLRNWVYKKYGMLKEACLHIHLNVSGEKIFFRRISNLAIQQFAIKQPKGETKFNQS